MEFETLKLLFEMHQISMIDAFIMVKSEQFYGIEIEDFPCQVAQLSMVLMKHLMDREMSDYFGINIIEFPIRESATIVRGNALRIDWNEVCTAERLNYIIGNPPFIGYSMQSNEQKEDILSVFLDRKGKAIKTAGKIDFVAGWYYKAAQYMQGTAIRAAFVSTNSITQGDQVAPIWGTIIPLFGIKIDFAYRTFKWGNEAKANAAVHCVIIGFSPQSTYAGTKYIFDHGISFEVMRINPYLVEADNVFIASRSKPLNNIPQMITGNRPVDGGHLIIEAREYEEFVNSEPDALKYIKKMIGSKEFINGLDRYCLWLVGVSPKEIRQMPKVLERVDNVRKARLSSPDAGARALADTPTLFREIYNPESAIVIPLVSSENRRYVPIGFIDSNTITTNLIGLIPNATLFHFGILTSNVHMAWMRTVAGRLEMRYRYSKDIVYNNFIWPDCTPAQKEKIEQTAQGILDARANYPNDSYADLYDDTVMPPDLRRAHQANDRAVWEAYGRAWPIGDEAACVAHLMRLYQEKTVECTK